MRQMTDFKITTLKYRAYPNSNPDLIQGYFSLEFEKDIVVEKSSITLGGKASIRMAHVFLSNEARHVFIWLLNIDFAHTHLALD